MGFKDMWLFNIALLGKQVERLVDNKDTLCYRVLAPKYFLNDDPFNPKHMDKPSFVWTSIVAVARHLVPGFGWKVGNGRLIDIYTNH